VAKLLNARARTNRTDHNVRFIATPPYRVKLQGLKRQKLPLETRSFGSLAACHSGQVHDFALSPRDGFALSGNIYVILIMMKSG
jgi:hypothetical protein